MRRGGFLLLVLLVVVIAVGFYRGWWTFNKEPFEKDKEQATEKLKEEGQKLKRRGQQAERRLEKLVQHVSHEMSATAATQLTGDATQAMIRGRRCGNATHAATGGSGF